MLNKNYLFCVVLANHFCAINKSVISMFKNMIFWWFLSILMRVSHDFGWFFATRIREAKIFSDPTGSRSTSLILFFALGGGGGGDTHHPGAGRLDTQSKVAEAPSNPQVPSSIKQLLCFRTYTSDTSEYSIWTFINCIFK